MAETLKQLVRLIGSDIPGSRPVYAALRKGKGVSYHMSQVVCMTLGIPKQTKIGALSDVELKQVEDLLRNPLKHHIPPWLLNRRKDYDTGEDKHLLSTDIKFRTEFDIKRLKKIRSYRGMRHAFGQPSRGQRTRSHFRKGKTVGVRKKGGAKKGRR